MNVKDMKEQLSNEVAAAKAKEQEFKDKMASMSFEELLNAIDIYRVREVEKLIRTFMELPVNRSLRIEIKNIMEAVDKMSDEQFDLVNAKLEELVTIDDLKWVGVDER